jgi:hypothetical protein
LKKELQELVSMRAARLISDDEFVSQRETIRTRQFELDADRLGDTDNLLTPTEISDLVTILGDLESAWETLPTDAKRGFGQLVFPAGYTFQKISSAERGLLFRFADDQDGDSQHGRRNETFRQRDAFEESAWGSASDGAIVRTQSNTEPDSISWAYLRPLSRLAALVRNNPNAILAEIRSLLTIVRLCRRSKTRAA